MVDTNVLGELQAHTKSRPFKLPRTARELHAELRKILWNAHNAKKVTTSPKLINERLKLVNPPSKLHVQLTQQQIEKGAYCIVVGEEKNQERSRDLPHIMRRDGAFFDFTITVREEEEGLELLAYDFEIRLPPAFGAPFLRFDLNLPGHANEARELRCHLHPGFDDVLVPAPLMAPTELLIFFIEHLRPMRESPRTPTAFEVEWFRNTFDVVKSRFEKTKAPP